MFGLFKSKETPKDETLEPENPAVNPEPKPEKQGFFSRLKQGLTKTRTQLSEGLATVFLGRKTIDDELFEELEMILLSADVGIETTDRIIEALTQDVSRKDLKDPQALFEALKVHLNEILEPSTQPLVIPEAHQGPFVILMVGVNGVGKTTTIGKLAKKFQNDGQQVMLAAGDTFRAAAVEQLKVWGERNNIPVIAQDTGADSASVIYDAMQSASAKNIDVLIADTAGRLHTQNHLMDELNKIQRVMQKFDVNTPHEVMIVLDATTGQNALTQAQQFSEVVNLSGITLSKLDGTAKGGIVFAIANQLELPIRFIGVGESIDDLRPFNSSDFVNALFSKDD